MSVTQILNTALSQLHASQEALRVTSNNIANVNTPDYAREAPAFVPKTIFGDGVGVDVANIERVVDRFLSQQFLTAQSSAQFFDAKVKIHDQVQSFFGSPDSSVSLPGQISNMFTEIADLTLNPSSGVARDSALGAISSLFNSMSSLSNQILEVQADINRQIEDKVKTANLLLGEIHDLNKEISRQITLEQSPNALQNQRESLISDLSEIVDLRVNPQPNGSVTLMTKSGFELLGTLVPQLKFEGGGVISPGVAPPQITVDRKNPVTGEVVNSGEVLDFHLTGGEIRGLLNMRDTELPGLVAELGNLNALIADQLNAVHNQNSAVPAPNVLAGHNTGLLATDNHNFSGQTTLVVSDQNGALLSRIDLDFDANTYSVNGGAAVAFGGTSVADLVGAINAALGSTGNGSASLSNGVVSIQATPAGAGLSFQESASTPSNRGGRTLSHFFGLNDLVTGSAPTHHKTGLTGTDAHGFTPGDSFEFAVRDAQGKPILERTFTVGGGTVTDLINDLNSVGTGMGEVYNFSLSAEGQILATPLPGYEEVQIYIGNDSTNRGGTGMTLDSFFGLSQQNKIDQALGLQVDSGILSDPSRFALAQLDLSAPAIGTTVLAIGDNRGALAFDDLINQTFSIPKAGSLSAQTATIGDYAATILSALGLRADQANYAQQIAQDLYEEVEIRKQEVQGVNLDEELSNMIVYQQSYNAAARVITAAQELMDSLLEIV